MKLIKCKPVRIPTIWAGCRLSVIRGYDCNEKIGIIREVCSYPGSENLIETCDYHDMNLRDLIDNHHQEIMGDDPSEHLLRAAYIDSSQDLSIQVHPNDEQAKLVNDYGKNECWYILDCGADASIIAGVSTDNLKEIRGSITNGTLDKYLIKIPVKPGDFAMIPAGLVHACGGNILALEVGSFGGITYRVYDYGRPRPLDIEKSLEVMDTSLRCELKHFPIEVITDSKTRNAIINKDFVVDIIDVSDGYEISDNKHYLVIVCIHNNCEVLTEDEHYHLEFTGSIIVPAIKTNVKIVGNARLLMCYRNPGSR